MCILFLIVICDNYIDLWKTIYLGDSAIREIDIQQFDIIIFKWQFNLFSKPTFIEGQKSHKQCN